MGLNWNFPSTFDMNTRMGCSREVNDECTDPDHEQISLAYCNYLYQKANHKNVTYYLLVVTGYMQDNVKFTTTHKYLRAMD